MLFKSRLIMWAKEGDGDGGGGGGGGTDDTTQEWVNNLPEPVREWEEVKTSDSPEKFWDQITNHRTFLGQSIRIPGEDASDEAKAEFNQKLMDKVPGLMQRPDMGTEEGLDSVYNLLGRPEKAEEYMIPDIEADIEIDHTMSETFKEVAHKHGLSTKQYQGIVTDITKSNLEGAVVAKQKVTEEQTALKTEWGQAYDQRMQRVAKIAELTNAPADLVSVIKAGLINAESAKWLYDLSTRLRSEDTNLINDRSGDQVMSPDEARIKISEIRNNRKHPYWHKSDPGNQAARKLMSDLYKLATPK